MDLIEDSDPSTTAKSSKVLENQASNIVSCPKASINDKEDVSNVLQMETFLHVNLDDLGICMVLMV